MLPLLWYTCLLGHWFFPTSGSYQMGKAKTTHPGEIKGSIRYANMNYLVNKCQFEMFLLVKSTEKSQRAEKVSEKFCDDSLVPLSTCGEGETLPTQLSIIGLWVIWFKYLHNSPSSHFPWDISGFFSEEDLDGKVLRIFPTLLLAWDLNSTAGMQLQSSFTSYANPPCLSVCFCSMVQLSSAGETGTGQIPPVTPGSRSGVGAVVFLVFPMCSAKAADPETLQVDWTSVLKRSYWQWAHWGCVSCDREGETCAGSQGAVGFGRWRQHCFRVGAVVSPACDSRLPIMRARGSSAFLPGLRASPSYHALS